ncbi:MAG: hypothetical protein KAS32_24530 [Candidatus Peribacteraceae bacterium]|nr:hypothetical protein [Candidatus Peribacteraceae bacterium]
MDNVDTNVLYGVIAVIVFCVSYVALQVVGYFKGQKTIAKLQRFKPYAVSAAKWVEKQVPDDYGKGKDSPQYAKAAHKLDLFLREFNALITRAEGVPMNQILKEEAIKWSVELADRLGKLGKKNEPTS